MYSEVEEDGCEITVEFFLSFDGTPDETFKHMQLFVHGVDDYDVTNYSSCFDSNPQLNSSGISFDETSPTTYVLTYEDYFEDCTVQDEQGEPYIVSLAEFTISGNAGECVNFDNLITFILEPTASTNCLYSFDLTGEYCFEGTTIRGNVMTPDCSGGNGGSTAEEIENIAIQIEDVNTGAIHTTYTDENGYYEIKVCEGTEYNVKVDEVCTEICRDLGVTVYDITLMSEIILGIDDYSDVAYFGGDINGNGAISVYDIVCIRQNILYILGACEPTSGSWCNFVPNSVVDNYEDIMADGNGYSNTETVSVPEGGSAINVDFTMYALGDMDCSCNASSLFSATDNPVSITAIPDRNGEYEVSMNTSKNLELFGVEFDLPSNTVEITDFESNNGMDWNYNTTPDGQLRIIGINTTGTTESVAANTAVFSFKLNQSVANLELSNNEANNILMDDDGLVAAIQQGASGNRSNFNVELTQTIAQGDDLTVQLTAQATQPVSISVFDIFGRTIYQNDQDLNEGINDFNLPISTPEGIYILSVFDGERYQSEKVYFGK